MLPKKYLPYTPQGEREKTGGREGEEEKGGEGKEKRRIIFLQNTNKSSKTLPPCLMSQYKGE